MNVQYFDIDLIIYLTVETLIVCLAIIIICIHFHNQLKLIPEWFNNHMYNWDPGV